MFDAKIIRGGHAMLRRLRAALDGLDFCEVTTPIRHADGKLRECMELQLRPALEKFPAVYEIGPCFRDDPPDATHLPEFHMLELFWDRPSFDTLVRLTHDLLEVAFNRCLDWFEIVDLSEQLPSRYPGCEYHMPYAHLKAWARQYLPAETLATANRAYKIYNALIDRLVDELKPGTIERPAMVVNYPMETVCVANPQADHPERIERAEFFVEGLEIAHGFVDDMDPVRVRNRMNENGSDFLDEDFLCLLSGGRLPASSGVGFGLDRLMMVEQGIGDIRRCVLEDAA